MTDREKLIDLLMRSHGIEPVDYRGYEWAADYLIARGVTINRGTEDTPVDYKLSPTEPLANCQQWISVTERLPVDWCPVLVMVSEVEKPLLGSYRENVWFHERWNTTFVNGAVTHWMPLPEPPKGE